MTQRYSFFGDLFVSLPFKNYRNMKKSILSLALLIFGVSLCASAASGRNQLMFRLNGVVGDSCFLFGQHDATAYGRGWRYEPGRSDVSDVTGDQPALLSWDIAGVEIGSGENIDKVPHDFIRQQIIEHDARGGISTISWHAYNPVTGGTPWDTVGRPVDRIFKDRKLRRIMEARIDSVARFVASLRDSAGRQIPVIFRPWMEMNGRWFWWGKGHRTDADYRKLWKLTYDRFKRAGLKNVVVWCYAPNILWFDNELTDTYPGDSMVDVVGVDVYQTGDDVTGFSKALEHSLRRIGRFAASHGKLIALAEVGSDGLLTPGWWDTVVLPIVKHHPVAWVLTWRNSAPDDSPFFVPYKGHHQEDSFRNFYRDPATLFLRDLPRPSFAPSSR